MAIKFIKPLTLAVLALMNSSVSQGLVSASYQQVSQGVLRIDLERQEIHHNTDRIQLFDTVDIDKMNQYDASGDPLNNEDVLIDMEEASLNYS